MLAIGTVFADRYEVLRCLSAGGMGAIYEVLHRETRRRRALKVMLPSMVKDADLRRRFALEAQITADIESEHLVETFDAGIDAATGSPFLVMELLRGENLGVRLTRHVRLSPGEVVGLLTQASSALDKTHAAGIVHRDLKPENLFVTEREGTLRLKVLDFGIAKVLHETQGAKVTRSLGTPLFMAPEQFEGDPRIGPAADLYALGHIAYALLVGEPYWSDEARVVDNALALMAKVSRGASEAATVRAARNGVALPPTFDAWFAKATARAPAERFSSAGEQTRAMADALEEAQALGGPVRGTVPLELASSDRPGTPRLDGTPSGDAGNTPDAAAARGSGSGRDLAVATTEARPPGDRASTGAGTAGPPARPRGPSWVAVGAVVAVVTVVATALLSRGSGPAPAPATSPAAAPSVTEPSAPPATAAAPVEEPVVAPAASASAVPAPPPAATEVTSPPGSSPPSRPAAPRTTPPKPGGPTTPTAPAAPPPSPDEAWRTR